MKKILTILLVAILASATLFAVDISGRFRAGYTFKFNDGVKIDPWKTSEAKFTIKVSDDAGIWTINFKDWGEGDDVGALDSDDKFSANLSLDLAALLAANEVDLGDVSLGLNIGANTKMTALSAYNDVTGDGGYKVKNNGKYSSEVAVGYGDLVQVKLAFDPTVKEAPIVASVKTTPIEGLSASVAYANYGVMYLGGTDDTDYPVASVLGFAVNADIAALAGLDFSLGVTAYDNIGFDTANVNAFAAAVYGGVDVVDAFFEFRMQNQLVEGGATTCGMKTQVNFNVVENLGLDAYLSASDFSDFGNTFAVGGDVSYTISGVEFAANMEYGAGAGFSVTPKVIVVF